MSSLRPTVPEVSAILRAWLPFKQVIGVTSVRTKADYRQARATLEALLDEVGSGFGNARLVQARTTLDKAGH